MLKLDRPPISIQSDSIEDRNPVTLDDIIQAQDDRLIIAITWQDKPSYIELRRIRYLEYLKIRGELMAIPEFKNASDEIADIVKITDFNPDYKPTKEQTDRLSVLDDMTKQYTTRFYLPCFVNPKITTVEQYDKFISQLDAADRQRIEVACPQMADFASMGDFQVEFIQMCKDIGIELPKELQADKITAKAMNTIIESYNKKVKKENEAASKLFN